MSFLSTFFTNAYFILTLTLFQKFRFLDVGFTKKLCACYKGVQGEKQCKCERSKLRQKLIEFYKHALTRQYETTNPVFYMICCCKGVNAAFTWPPLIVVVMIRHSEIFQHFYTIGPVKKNTISSDLKFYLASGNTGMVHFRSAALISSKLTISVLLMRKQQSSISSTIFLQVLQLVKDNLINPIPSATFHFFLRTGSSPTSQRGSKML